jgi:hypothetical protein
VNVPTTAVVEIHAGEKKLKRIGGTPPLVCTAHALGKVGELVMIRGSAIWMVYVARALCAGRMGTAAKV